MEKSESILRWPEEIAAFKALSQPMQVKAGYVVFTEEEPSDYVYFIETGHVKIYRNTNLGKISMITIRKSNDMFGIPGALLGETRCTSAETIERSKLWRMERKIFIEMLYNCPQLAMQVVIAHSKYLRDTEQAFGNLMSMDVDCRLAWLIIKLTSTVSTPTGEKFSVNVRLTHQDIANMIGTCRQTVTTVLGRFKKDGSIDVGRRYIEIRDFNKLNKYVV